MWEYDTSVRLLTHVLCKSTSRKGHDNILKWNSSEYTAGECVSLKNKYKLCMLKTIKKKSMDFYNSGFPGEAKMCLGFMSFRASSEALKPNNFHKYATNYNLISGAI